MDGWFAFLVLLCAVGCGLNGGVFFAFSTFVMPALGRLTPGEGINAMKAINVTAITPIFMSLLFGTAALCALAIALALAAWGRAGSLLALIGGAVYIAGTILVTMLGNVPLNNALARVASADTAGVATWNGYLRVWTRRNHLRTFACTAAMALFAVALWRD